MNYEKEDQTMPEEELLKNNKRKKKEKRDKKVKVTSLAERNEARREYNDAIYYEKLSEEKPDITKPLQKGSVDMWFLLWSMILLCFGIVMCYSAGVVDAVESYDDPLHYLVRNIIFRDRKSVV